MRSGREISLLTYVFHKYKTKAKASGIAFELDKEYFNKLVKQNCHYCGRKPSNKRNVKKLNGSIVYSGIDRKDNRYGYTVKNTVSCCYTCNSIKGEFLSYSQALKVLGFIKLMKLKVKKLKKITVQKK